MLSGFYVTDANMDVIALYGSSEVYLDTWKIPAIVLWFPYCGNAGIVNVTMVMQQLLWYKNPV